MACASHDGEPVHVALVESILAGAGLTADDLRNPPGWPLVPVGRATARGRGRHQAEPSLAQLLRQTRGDAGGDRGLGLGPRRVILIPPTLSKPESPNSCRDTAGPVEPDRGRWLWRSRVRHHRSGDGPGICPAGDAAPSFSKSSTPCMPSLRWFRVSATSMPPSPPISMRSAKRGAAGVLGIGLRGRLGSGGQGLGRLGSRRRGGRAGGPRPVGSVDSPCPRSCWPRHSHPSVEGGGKPVGRFEPRLELRWQ